MQNEKMSQKKENPGLSRVKLIRLLYRSRSHILRCAALFPQKNKNKLLRSFLKGLSIRSPKSEDLNDLLLRDKKYL